MESLSIKGTSTENDIRAANQVSEISINNCVKKTYSNMQVRPNKCKNIAYQAYARIISSYIRGTSAWLLLLIKG